MKSFDLCGMGNALVDVLVDVSEQEFSAFDVERASMRLVDAPSQHAMLSQLQARAPERSPRLVSGGSIANSLLVFSQLGGKGALSTLLGDDRYGIFYKSECDHFGIELGNSLIVDEPTGTCLVLITPDAERTMRTSLGVNERLSTQYVDTQLIGRSRWLFIEGYLFANPNGPEAVAHAVQAARNSGTKIALTLSEDFIPANFASHVLPVLLHADLIFCNEREAKSLSGAPTWREAFQVLSARYPGVVVTGGRDGALISFGGVSTEIQAFPCTPVDLTGAGDVFAGTFLYGITHGFGPADAGKAAAYLAMQVIIRHGARLPSGAREFWSEALGWSR